ncbi:hemerythrin domain-containing protein [Massilia solisilvae]|uniref:Hemerythrin domain-containing protein n=1 Tax=Massilia solisilvae TaxID=1811225 RepID=A0ABT2BPU5_9BURK|nr:hemerythrin domain-containing protein [Massilia solisilvae]MCS0610514.1 hemerythrin domain-containing protein [Massilia solisilvae]
MEANDDPVKPVQTLDPVEHPLDLLIRDHELVRKLADKYCHTQDKEVQKQAAKQMLQALHTHSRVEESVFYPGVRQDRPGHDRALRAGTPKGRRPGGHAARHVA